MTTTISDQQNISGRTAIDVNGAEIGKVKQVHVDDRTGQPLWVAISTGIFGMRWHLAPRYGSQADGDALRLAVTKDNPAHHAVNRVGDLIADAREGLRVAVGDSQQEAVKRYRGWPAGRTRRRWGPCVHRAGNAPLPQGHGYPPCPGE
jgi:hypothetical protein